MSRECILGRCMQCNADLAEHIYCCQELELKAMPRQGRKREALWHGAIAGLTGAWAMSQCTRLWRRILHRGKHHKSFPPLPYSQQEWDSTAGIAKLTARAFGIRLSPQQTATGAEVVHYGVGALAGVIYEVGIRSHPRRTGLSGIAYGCAIWIFAQELLIPALGITPRLREYSLAAQTNSLCEHISYGVILDSVSRVLKLL